MIYMLDTDTSIYAMGRRHTSLLERLAMYEGRVCISSITYAELMFGAHRSQRIERNLLELETFIRMAPVNDFGRDAAEAYGEVRRDLQQAGTPVGPFDLLVGAHARSLGLTLVTNDRREFDRIPGLRVENWVA